MLDAENRAALATASGATAAEIDAGLRAFLLNVLVKVALGLALAGGVAYATSSIPPLRDQLFQIRAQGEHTAITFTGPGLALALSPLLALMLFGGGRQSGLRSAMLYWSVAATIGASGGALLLVYTGASLATTFAAAAAGFGGLCLFGYTTRRDLGAGRAFLTTGLIGLLAAIAFNLLLGSSALSFAINVVGVLVFAGLIAYDMQKLKLIYHHARDSAVDLEVSTNTGALCLFLDFVNLYQFLLALVGGRR